MKLKFDFIPQGSKVVEKDGSFVFKDRFLSKEWDKTSTVVLDTGNALRPGLVDHHQAGEGATESCVASLIEMYHEKYLGHLLGQEEVTIVTHYVPDLDAIGAVYFTIKYLKSEKFNANTQLLSEYILEVDSGKLAIDPEEPVGIASVWLSVTNNDADLPPFQRDNAYILNKGIEFLSLIENLLKVNCNPWDTKLFNTLEGFDEHIEKVLNDKKAYYDDVSLSSLNVLELFNKDSGGYDSVDCILTNRPKSFLWKYWVRGDKQNSQFNKGFPITCAHFEYRSIISVDPNTPYNLLGLGLLIDHLEILKLKREISNNDIENGVPEVVSGKEERPGPRPGFHRNDPWYDGRGFHNFTIIDGPRAGSKLSVFEIESAVFATRCWEPYANLINNKKEENIVLEDILSLPIMLNDVDSSLQFLSKITSYDEHISNGILSDNLIQHLRNLMQLSLKDKLVSSDVDKLFFKQGVFISEWLNKYCGREFDSIKEKIAFQLKDVLDSNSFLTILNLTKDLPVAVFCMFLASAEKVIRKSDFIEVLFQLQNKHPLLFAKGNVKQVQLALENNGIDSTELINLIQMISISYSHNDHYEELPLYGFNKLKNYIDDLLVCNDLVCDKKGVSLNTRDFISKDFLAFFSPLSYHGKENHNLEEFLIQLRDLKIEFLHQLFGKSFEKLRASRTELFSTSKPEEAKILKKYTIDELLTLTYSEHNEYVKVLHQEVRKGGNYNVFINSKYNEGLLLIKEFSALEDLYIRSNKFSQLKIEIENQLVFSENTFLKEFNKLIYQLFYALNIYSNTNDISLFEKAVNESIDTLNTLRTISNEEDFIGTETLREQIYLFLPALLAEISLDVKAIDAQIEQGLSQYSLLNSESGILKEVSTLPIFYKALLEDVFCGFKRYYRERVTFFRKDLKHIIDLTDSSEDERVNKEYIGFCNKLINESVKFDWEEIKELVDYSSDTELTLNFYQKYFAWQKLNINNSFSELSKINSEIRFSEGRSSRGLEETVNNLPNISSTSDLRVFLNELAFKWDLNKVLTHLPSKLIFQSYDFLLNYYIEKMDVENVKNSLSVFSTKFPWYYVWFTNKKILSLVFLSFSILLFSAGAFDPNIYEIHKESFRPPLPDYLFNALGARSFLILSKIIGAFWGILLSLTFLVPISLGVYFGVKSLLNISTKKNSNKFEFMRLISSIEGKQGNLLYISFILPLLFVVLQMASPNKISMINKIEGVRLLSTLLIIIGLTVLAVYLYVKEKNPNKSLKWLISRTEHMLWLHLLQAVLLTVFVIDLVLRFELSLDLFPEKSDLISLGISKYIELDFGYFDVRIMPIFTLLVSLLSLFFSFFIDKVMGRK
jgi:hypothetical protein